MASRAAATLQKPVLVYDGNCSFCRYWVDRWKAKTGNKIKYVPFQAVPDSFYGVTHAEFSKSVYLITQYGQRLHGAKAVAVLLQLSGFSTWSWLYHRVPLASFAAEAGYRLVADHRDLFYRITKLVFKSEN